MSVFHDLMEGLDETEAHLDGKRTGAKVHLPETLDVKRLRSKLHMTQTGFANTFGFSVDAVRHWEAGRRTPEASARALLLVIAHDPKTVIAALAAPAADARATEGRSLARR
jgi:putative transcriptional regulator